MVIHEMLLQIKKKYMAIETNKRIGPGDSSKTITVAIEEPQELEEDVDQQTSTAAMQRRGRGIRRFVEQLCGEGGDVCEGWTASERKRSWRVCRRLETSSRQWIGQCMLFKLFKFKRSKKKHLSKEAFKKIRYK